MTSQFQHPDDGDGEVDPPQEEITLPTQFIKTDCVTSQNDEIYMVNEVFDIEQFNEYCTSNNLTPKMRVENTKFNEESDYYSNFKTWIAGENDYVFSNVITNATLSSWFGEIETKTLLFIFKTNTQ